MFEDRPTSGEIGISATLPTYRNHAGSPKISPGLLDQHCSTQDIALVRGTMDAPFNPVGE